MRLRVEEEREAALAQQASLAKTLARYESIVAKLEGATMAQGKSSEPAAADQVDFISDAVAAAAAAAQSVAARAIADAGVRVVPATGRARAGAWTDAVLTHPILNNGVPGVYINGCSGFTEAGDELAATHLPPAVVTRVLDWAAGAEAAAWRGVVDVVAGVVGVVVGALLLGSVASLWPRLRRPSTARGTTLATSGTSTLRDSQAYPSSSSSCSSNNNSGGGARHIKMMCPCLGQRRA